MPHGGCLAGLGLRAGPSTLLAGMRKEGKGRGAAPTLPALPLRSMQVNALAPNHTATFLGACLEAIQLGNRAGQAPLSYLIRKHVSAPCRAPPAVLP